MKETVRQKVAVYLGVNLGNAVCDTCVWEAIGPCSLVHVKSQARYWSGTVRGRLFGFERGPGVCAKCAKHGLVTKRGILSSAGASEDLNS